MKSNHRRHHEELSDEAIQGRRACPEQGEEALNILLDRFARDDGSGST
jgi:hypothetical protein